MTSSDRDLNKGWDTGGRPPPELEDIRAVFNAELPVQEKRAQLEAMRTITLDHALGVDGQRYDRLLHLIDSALNAL